MTLDAAIISDAIQQELKRRGKTETTPPEAGRWLEGAGVLPDRSDRPGAPLRALLRMGQIAGAEKDGRFWRIRRIDL